MTFLEANKSFLKNMFNFNGRARRSEFWWVQLSLFLIVIVASFTIVSLPLTNTMFIFAFTSFILISMIILGVMEIALIVRRLHDIDRSGWFFLLYYLPIGCIILFVFMFIPGTIGLNRFGPDPKMFYNQYNPNINNMNNEYNPNMNNMNNEYNSNMNNMNNEYNPNMNNMNNGYNPNMNNMNNEYNSNNIDNENSGNIN